MEVYTTELYQNIMLKKNINSSKNIYIYRSNKK